MGILLAFVATLLAFILIPIGVIYEIITLFRFSKISKYFYQIAISIDQLGNVACQGLLNDVLIKKNGWKFGNPDETISSVLGKNYVAGTLTFIGNGLRWTLDQIDENHCIKSIDQ